MNVIELCPFTRNVLSKCQKLVDSTDASYSYADTDATSSELGYPEVIYVSELCSCAVGSSDVVSQNECVNERCKSTSLLISLFC